ncbi:methylenetetrahydrofolate reductase [Nesterenkonia natronophila]|uniref:Methylenetetrahydrofolate reductase n=1 Tax=Nesterenkonia natronophila TaxID=2174932 RepID=A0A3A4F2D4_9MICC|nr:methylenetetrahydrofolate reductase [Nesterenkonia natronophila]RJN32452.1 5,10-methylenetetrahydrofolate reductase [Nesterenkonia natronophila]
MSSPVARSDDEKRVLASLVANISYEVMPFKSVRAKVLAAVPHEVPLTVTATGKQGLEPTIETSIFLREKGYTVAPHVPARMVSGPDELDAVVSRLEAAQVDRIFIVGGDVEEPAGTFTDALSLLRSLRERGHHFKDVGVGGYPEGHAKFSQSDIERVLDDKAEYADRILTQICFDPDTITAWASGLRDRGVDLPVYVGMPGAVSRQKLMRISAGLGLGQSASFLKKQQNMFWKMFSPSGYNPSKLVRGLVRNLAQSESTVTGFHIFTFNDLANTEAWRRDLISQSK